MPGHRYFKEDPQVAILDHLGPHRDLGADHFDIATLVGLEQGDAETARAIGIGVSPGDESYSQPYVYISPWPHLDAVGLPSLPPPGHWHTQGFVAAVATGEEILALEERGPGLLAFISGAFEIGRARLGA